MLIRNFIAILTAFSFMPYIQSQDISALHTTIVYPQKQDIFIASAPIIPSSITVRSLPSLKKIDNAIISVKQDSLLFNWPENISDSIQLNFRTLPKHIGLTMSHFDTTKIRYGINQEYIGFDIGSNEPINNLELAGLDYDGSFLRGLTLGNNQSLFLNSAFNLQIAGNIGDDTEILAALTDENIPIQPQGNTQQLNEFDKIFIQIKNKNKTLIAGDYELKNNPSHFLRYFKKLKGGSFNIENSIKDKYQFSTKVSAAISRGKFARSTIETQEGNQGPYRLQGAEGERFIIILAGSERIYYDGKPLKRGIEEDYIIDYNQAEVRFTSKQLITKDSRIIIEFEYTFEIYNRGFYAIHSEIKTDKLKIGTQFYNEQDGTTPSSQFTFTDEQLSVLRDAGDDPLKTVGSSIRPFNAENSLNPVTYKLIDTTINGQVYPRLIFSSNQNTTLYTATFSNVGQGNGNYIQADPTINGQVFTWIPPDSNGSGQGSFAPTTNLITPTKKQVLAINGEYKLNENNFLSAELSVSNNDPNKLSGIDDEDNIDFAGFIDYKKIIPISEKWSSHISLTYESIGKNYQAINPFRRQEFLRDWNTDQFNDTKTIDQIGIIEIGISQKENSNISYALSTYDRKDIYQGINHEIEIDQKLNTLSIKARANLLNSDSDIEQTNFLRPSLEINKIFKNIKGLKISFRNNFEKNEIKKLDVLSARSFQFYEQTSTIEKSVDKGFSWKIAHKYREDQKLLTNVLSPSSSAQEIEVGSSITSKKSRLSLNGHYRKLSVNQNFTEEIDPQETYLGKIEHNWKIWNGGLIMTNSYELGSGQDERVDVIFVETLEAGQGAYIHKELTGDDIKQNFEFFLAPFDNQGNFVRITLGSTDFIRTHNVRFNQNLKLSFNKILKNTVKYKIIKKISFNSNLLSRKTNEATSSKIVWNPFSRDLLEGVIIGAENRWKSTLFFNRADPLYQLQYSFTQRQNKNLFTTGFESRENYNHNIQGRINLNKSLSSEITLQSENRKNDNEIFTDRNYNITSKKIEPRLTYIASRKLRLRGSMAIEMSTNNPGLEKSESIEASFNFQLRNSTKSSVQGEFSYNNVQVNGDINPSLELDFLRGLTPGNNLIWNLSVDRTIAKNLRLSMVYDGRKLGSGNMVHTGSAQIGATF